MFKQMWSECPIEEIAIIVHHEKCIRLLVLIAVQKQKFLSNQMEPALFTARIVIENDDQVDINNLLNSWY